MELLYLKKWHEILNLNQIKLHKVLYLNASCVKTVWTEAGNAGFVYIVCEVKLKLMTLFTSNKCWFDFSVSVFVILVKLNVFTVLQLLSLLLILNVRV